MYKSSDIQWLYSEEKGFLPFVTNNDNTRVKDIYNKLILPIPENLGPAEALQQHYKLKTVSFCDSGDITAYHLNMLQYLLTFRGKDPYQVTLSESQVILIKKFADHNEKVERQKYERFKTRKEKINKKAFEGRDF